MGTLFNMFIILLKSFFNIGGRKCPKPGVQMLLDFNTALLMI